jgi:hypothetical protein
MGQILVGAAAAEVGSQVPGKRVVQRYDRPRLAEEGVDRDPGSES